MEVTHDIEEEEVVDLVHSLVLQSRPNPSVFSTNLEDPFSNRSSTPTQMKVKSVPNSPCLSNMPRSQSLPVRKKVQIKSAPLKPPDILNASLFPSVEETALIDSASSSHLTSSVPKRIPLKRSSTNSSKASVELSTGSENVLSLNQLAQDKKLKTLEAILTEPVVRSEPANERRRASLNINELPTTPSRKTPRSLKLFSELSVERREQLDGLAEKYARSIDFNQCRNILDELEFLFQLFNTSTNSCSVKNNNKDSSNSSVPLLSGAAEQAYFAIKVVIDQLDKLFVTIPMFIPQLIIDNYPHKIPKPVRKHIDDWLETQKQKDLKNSASASLNSNIPIELAKTVTFQSEKDGRLKFLHQTDFHAFCKQRDLFYSIRESWTSMGTGNGSTETISDRNKSRMSFPPPAPTYTRGANSSSSTRSVDSMPFKVQSLFQMNMNPTNLFHMASLFVSHYLLEARAQEVGGVPRDDTMKEFFQSNPTKLLQLNSRFSMNASAEMLESEGVSNFTFHKQFLSASSPKFVQHVVDRLVFEISEAEAAMEEFDLTSPNHICRKAKDTVYLARLLGFAHFLPYLPDEMKQHNIGNVPINSIERESVLQEHIQFRSYHNLPIDLKEHLKKACRTGRLTTTCPWIIEYLLQCDSLALLLPSYQPVLRLLLSLYKNVLIVAPKSSNVDLTIKISLSNMNFIRLHIGVLFSSKHFPDSVLSLLKTSELTRSNELNNDIGLVDKDGFIDLLEEVAHTMVDFFFEHTFKRFKIVLSWGKLQASHPAITGEFRHIRPIPAPSSSVDTKKLALLSKERILQSQLEDTFFKLYRAPVKRSVDFVVERMADNFVTMATTVWFPNFRILLQNQGIFGVRAAEKCRMRMEDEMNKYFTDRCNIMVKLMLEPIVTAGVLELCQKVAIRKAREAGLEWIKHYITAAMFPDIGASCDSESKGALAATTTSSSTSTVKSSTVPEDPPFEVLILIHRTLRKLNSRTKIDPQLVDIVLSCQALSRASWAFIPLVDWGIALITFQPQVLSPLRTKQLVTLWKSLWNLSGSTKILNARNLMLISKSDNPRDSWIKLGSVTQHLITEGLIKADHLEQQCMQLLREEWPDQVHKRISEFLTIVLESFHERADYHGSESAQVLDWVAWLCSGQPDQD